MSNPLDPMAQLMMQNLPETAEDMRKLIDGFAGMMKLGPRGRRLLTVRGREAVLRSWPDGETVPLETGQETSGIVAACFSRSGRRLAIVEIEAPGAAASGAPRARKYLIRVFDATDGDLVHEATHENGAVQQVRFISERELVLLLVRSDGARPPGA